MGPPPINHVLIETSSGITLRGATLVDLRQHLGNGITGIQPSVSWNALVGAHEQLQVGPEGLHAALRRWFSWEDALTRTAHLLNLLGSPKTLVDQRGHHIAMLALADDWPAKVVGYDALLKAIVRGGMRFFPMNEHGLFWLLLDALRAQWPPPSEALTGAVANRRFARLVFIAADGMGLGPLQATSNPSAEAPANADARSPVRAPFATARVLVPAGRLNHHDHPEILLVRSYELFVEILGASRPSLSDRFRQVRGVGIGEWIVGLAWLANRLEATASSNSPQVPILHVGPVKRRSRNAMTAILEQLARPADHFVARLAALVPTLQPRELPTQALREAPIVELDEERFLVTHRDFLKAQADDGVFYTFVDNLRGKEQGEFFKLLGAAIETYAGRVLTRCAALDGTGGQVARVDETRGQKRCDFIWVRKNRAIYVETKRLGLSVEHLHGRAELGERLAKELGEACRQLLATQREIVANGADSISSALVGVPISPNSTAIIITQSPTFAWFSTRREVVPADILEEWLQVFGVPPVVWSLSELELLEAALPTVKLDAILDAIAGDHPATYAGLAEFLTRAGYRGPTVSPYYEAKSRLLLANQVEDHPSGDEPPDSDGHVDE
jgi:hypothetical protein